MRSGWAVGRIIGLLIAIAAFGASIHATCRWVMTKDDFDRWLNDRPMDVAVDLSRPGLFTAPYRQTCSISHGADLYLEVIPLPSNSEGETQHLAALGRLRASFVVHAADGKERESRQVDRAQIEWRPDLDAYVLLGFGPFNRGEYMATFRVEAGVPELAGTRQRLYVKYLLCGMEQLPAALRGMAAIAYGCVGLQVAAIVLPGLVRHGLRRDPAVAGGGIRHFVQGLQANDAPTP